MAAVGSLRHFGEMPGSLGFPETRVRPKPWDWGGSCERVARVRSPHQNSRLDNSRRCSTLFERSICVEDGYVRLSV